MKKLAKTLPCLMLTFIGLSLVNSFSYTNFQMTDSSQSASSSYIFSFVPSASYNYIEAVITFPIEYSVSSFAADLQCFYSSSGIYTEYSENECWVEPDTSSNK